ncbi:MAG: tetratricopeptide repeat protein [Candidatus Melainabacteria bacterium]|nr:MAG: tetratricopeptide repeat protein [Candidatus Melainabacteria bacterium]
MKTKFLSSTLSFSAGITFSLLLPQSLLAEESSCHDYPGHREVLKKGIDQLIPRSYSGGLSSGFRYSRAEFGWGSRSPGSVESCIEHIKQLKKSKDDSVEEQVEHYAEYYFQKRKYGECHEFLEAVLDELEPKVRGEYYDVIAICYLLKELKIQPKEDPSYLEQLIGIVDKTIVLNGYSQNHSEKISVYVAKATDAQKLGESSKDPEIALRLGLLHLILGHKEEAIKFKNQVVSNFRKHLIFYPQQLRKDASKEGLEYLIQKNPDRYFSEIQAVAFKRGKELMLSGATSLCRDAGNVEDLSVIAGCWIEEMPQVSLEADKQVLLLKTLPESFKSKFSGEYFVLNCSDFSKVFEILKKRGWNAEAANFQNKFFFEGFGNLKKPGVEQITRYYFNHNDAKSALALYSMALKQIEVLKDKKTAELILAYARITPLYDDLFKFRVNASNPVAMQTKELYASVKHSYDVHKCLELAEKLAQTGWKLINQGDAKEAVKLFKSALDIREKNLPASSRILGSTYMDAGRAAALSSDVPFAEQCFKKALKIFNQNPISNDDDLKITVESYASLLNRSNRYDEAQKILAMLKGVR